MQYSYTPSGVCTTNITFDLDEAGIVTSLLFTDGCEGNLRAVSRLAEGMWAQTLIKLLSGNECGHKGTSCTDQLVRALEAALQEGAT